MAGTVVIAYDGSEGARHAVAAAGDLLDAQQAVIVHVRVLGVPPIVGADPAGEQSDSPDAAAQRQAGRLLDEAAEVAAAAGFEAEVLSMTADSVTGVWRTLLDVAEQRGAGAIVAGHRGLSRVQTALLGSVSNGLVNHAQIPVLVVPRGRR